MKGKTKASGLQFWLLVWGLGIAGQLCWNIENQWFNTFVYAKIAKDPTIIKCEGDYPRQGFVFRVLLHPCVQEMADGHVLGEGEAGILFFKGADGLPRES